MPTMTSTTPRNDQTATAIHQQLAALPDTKEQRIPEAHRAGLLRFARPWPTDYRLHTTRTRVVVSQMTGERVQYHVPLKGGLTLDDVLEIISSAGCTYTLGQ